MKQLSTIAIFFLIIGFYITTVTALELSAEYDTKTIIKEYDNPITVTIQITDASPGLYNIYTLADMVIEPQDLFTIDSDSFEKEFIFTPAKNLDVEGLYSFTYALNQRATGEKFEERVTVNRISIKDTLSINSESIGIEDDEITFTIKNTNDVSLFNITASFSSIVFDEFEETFDIEPQGTISFTVPADTEALRKTKAGIYIINTEFKTPEGDVNLKGNLFLGEKKGIATIEDAKGILLQTKTITKTNVGNTLEGATVTIHKNVFSRLFTTFSEEPSQINRNGLKIEYVWIKERLNPAESITITAKTNYILPFFIIIFAALFIIGLKRYNLTKIEVTKSVHPVKTKKGEFALRVTLNVKARTHVENVSLIDKVPAIVKIYNKFGTTAPDKIDASTRRLHWNIGDLEAGEERSFSYVVYSKVGIVGKFVLPSATAVFEKSGEIHESESNKVFFLNEQVR